MAPASRSDASLDLRHHAFLTVLYFGQGVLQGVAGRASLYLALTRPVEPHEAAALSLSIVPFSFKFLWAPIVDGVFWSRATRRHEWIIATQVVMALLLGGVFLCCSAAAPADGTPLDLLTGLPFSFTALLCVVTFFNATQDVALDAWAVEGVSEPSVARAPSVQNLGLVVGISAVQLCVALMDTYGFTPAFLFGAAFALYAVVLVLSVLYRYTEPYRHAVRLGIERHEADVKARAAEAQKISAQMDGSEKGDGVVTVAEATPLQEVKGIVMELLLMWRQPWYRWMLVVLLLPSLGFGAVPSFVQQRMLSIGVRPGFLSVLSLCMLPVTIATNLLAPALMTKTQPAFLVGVTDVLTTVLAAISVVVSITADVTTWEVQWGVLVPLSLVTTVVTTIHWVAGLAVIGKEARRHPSRTGSVLTCLQSISNLGSMWSSTAGLWILGAAQASPAFASYAATTVLPAIQPFVAKVAHGAAESAGGTKQGTDLAAHAVVCGGAAVLSLVFFAAAVKPALEWIYVHEMSRFADPAEGDAQSKPKAE